MQLEANGSDGEGGQDLRVEVERGRLEERELVERNERLALELSRTHDHAVTSNAQVPSPVCSPLHIPLLPCSCPGPAALQGRLGPQWSRVACLLLAVLLARPSAAAVSGAIQGAQ